VLQHKIKENLLLAGVLGMDVKACLLGARLARDGVKGIGHMSQYVEQITVLGIDDFLHLGQLDCTETLLFKAL
jgi:hypothetical protein